MIGYRIATLRIKRGLSQAEMGQLLGVCASTVGMYEQGRRNPPLDLIVRMSQEFNVSTDYLLTGKMSNSEACKNLYATETTAEDFLHALKVFLGEMAKIKV